MDDIRFTYRELIYGVIWLNVMLGAMFGALPLLAGLLWKQKRLAWIAFVLAIVGGGLLGVFLAFPVSMIFLWLIVRESKAAEAERADGPTARGETESPPDETPAE